MSYQDQVGQLKDAGFSGSDIQNWSDNQAVTLRQAGFGQDEVDSYQGMKAPPPGQPAVYGRLPTDDDFKNAATVILKGNDHPFYEKAVDTLKNLFGEAGVEPTQAVKAAQDIPSFRQIMENADVDNKGSYLQEAARSAGSAVAGQMQGVAELANPDPETNSMLTKPLFSIGPDAKKPEDYWLHQKGVAFQQWIDKKFPAQPEFEAAHPYKTGISGGLAQLPELVGTLGLGMAAGGAHSAYQEAEQAGAPVEKAVQFAGKSGALWGALGVTDVGVLMKGIERSAPGAVPWLVAKATQALRSGATFAGTNELGDWLNTEIAHSADIPMQYKPTLQRVITNALTGALAGVTGKTSVKEAPITDTGHGEIKTDLTTPPPSAPATTLTPAYHFDSDSYGLKNEKGEFVQTGFGTEQEARDMAEAAPAPTYPPTESRLAPDVIDRYKKTISDQAKELGIPLTDEQLQKAATVMAETHNPQPPEPQKPEVTPPEQPAYATVPKKPLGLADFVRQNGGINDEGGDVRSILGGAKYRPGLINGEGKSLDDMARAAQEAGYFTGDERTSINEFKEKLSDDLHGNPQHSLHDADKVEAYNDALRRNSEVDRISNETGIGAEGKTHTQFWDDVAKHYSKQEAAAKRTDLAERANDAYESWRTEALEPEELEDQNYDRTQDNAVKDQKPITKSTGPSEPAADYARGGEEVGGLGGRGIEPTGSAGPAEKPGTPATAVRTEPSAGGGDDKLSNSLEDEIFYHKIPSAEFSDKEIDQVPELKSLRDFVNQIAPNSRFSVRDKGIRAGDSEAVGFYHPIKDLITVALTAPNKWVTGAHEALHAIVHLLTDSEYKTLVNEGLDRGLMEKYDIEKNYSDRPDVHQEEMIAHWFGDLANDKRTGASPEAKGIFEKIKDIASQIGAKIRQLFGTENAEDIMNKIYSGEVGSRTGERLGEERELHQRVSDENKPTLGDAIRGIRDTISPTSAGDLAKKTEVEIRAAYGDAKRERAVAETALNEFARQATKMTPAEHMDFYNYVEGRSKGAQLKNPQFQAMADTIRDVYNNYKDLIQSMPEKRMMNFVTDYFTHQWAPGQDEKIKDFMNTWWQQGSGRNLKKRTIPTIAEGLDYGLKLAEPNPVRAVSRYAGSMSNYLASVKVLRAINTDLGGGYYADGMQPEGYKPLVGRNAERIENARIDPASGKIIPARNLKLYAPQQVADLYNAFYSKGFEDSKLKAPYMIARNAINSNTMLELGLSAYHFSTISMQSLNQDMGRILRNAVAGDWQGVGDAIKGLVTPALHFREGAKLMDQYNNLADHGINMEQTADEFAKSNMRIGLDPLSNVSTHGGFYKAWQRGELPEVLDRLKSQMTQGYGIGALKSGAEAVQRVVSDVAHPLFNTYIPAIKMSAFHDLMGDWLRQNPDASDAEVAENRVRIADMVEDRFGEMNMENIFWNKKAKELMGLGLRAPGWDIGLVRQAGGAGYDVYRMIKDGITKQGFDPGRLDRPLFMVGALLTYAAINSAMTYIKTGVAPSDQKLKDFIAYGTGGLHKAFGMHPERGELPGHGRELIQMAPVPGEGPLSGITQEAEGKVGTLPKKLYQAANNTDWNGKPIYDPKSPNWYQRTPVVAQSLHVLGGFRPFSMEQLIEGAPEGSNLSLAERFMGVRSAGAKIVNPEGLKKFNEEKRH